MSKRILLADDSLTIQKVVELTFADTDFEVKSTSSGDELLAKLPGADPNIIICDTIMPGTDGYLVCQKVKSEPGTLHIPVILLTGTFEPFDRDRALAAGCSEIITKPFEARKLVETVERLVSGETAEAPPTAELSEGAVAPPDFAAAVPPPPPQEAAAEFGTLLSEPLDEALPGADVEVEGEGLDFTATGFAEMEEAGEAYGAVPDEIPDEGLDFDLPAGDGPFADAQAEEADSDIPPDVPADALPEDPDEDFLPEDPNPFDDATTEELQTSSPEEDESYDFENDETVVEPALPEPSDPAVDFQPEVAAIPSPPETDPMEDSPPESPEEFEFGAAPEDSAVEADAIPIAAPVPAPQASDVEMTTPRELSDADVDRIARRVVELAEDRLEQIAWEVIPDMAEIVVRERLRELEAEVEHQTVPPTN